LDGIPQSPRGIPQVEVTFDIDSNGILNVKAKDKSSGKEQSIRIEAGSGLSPEEIEKMKKDAESHSEEDRKKKELAEARSLADQLIYTVEKSLKEYEKNIPEDLKKELGEKLDNLKKNKESGDLAVIKNQTEELGKSAQKIGQYVKSNEQSQGPQESGSSSGPRNQKQEGNIRDAEIKEDENPKDDENKK